MKGREAYEELRSLCAEMILEIESVDLENVILRTSRDSGESPSQTILRLLTSAYHMVNLADNQVLKSSLLLRLAGIACLGKVLIDKDLELPESNKGHEISSSTIVYDGTIPTTPTEQTGTTTYSIKTTSNSNLLTPDQLEKLLNIKT